MSDTDPSHERSTEEEILRNLETRRSTYEDFCQKAQTHIEECLRDEAIQIQSIQWRVKHPDKVRAKYNDPSKLKKYNRLDDLTDIAGLRVITYYETDVDLVRKLIEREFDIDPQHSEDKRIPDDPEKFTYHALHLIVSIPPKMLGDRAAKQFTGMRGEIQITSILRHAWAEIEHKWYDLKGSFPAKVKRRFARLSALIEMADEEFVALRNEFEESKKSIGLMVQIGDKEIPVDAQSLRAFIEQETVVGQVDQEIATTLKIQMNNEVSDAGLIFTEVSLNHSGIDTVEKLRSFLLLNSKRLVELASQLPFPPSILGRGDCIQMLSIFLANGLLQSMSDTSP
jgi:putative GTP pyrophosphokinase